MSIFVITYGTSDYGDRYVVREQRVYSPFDTACPPGFVPLDGEDSMIYVAREPMAVVTTLDEARARVPPGRYRLLAQPGDDPVIVETWV